MEKHFRPDKFKARITWVINHLNNLKDHKQDLLAKLIIIND